MSARSNGILIIALAIISTPGCIRIPAQSAANAPPVPVRSIEGPIDQNQPKLEAERPHRPSDLASDREKKPFDMDALYKVKRIDSPVWNPDGDAALFSVFSATLREGKSRSNIYLYDGQSQTIKRMTHFAGTDNNPIWAPDGKSFAFVSSREGSSQLWRMNVDGGEPEKITDVSTGVGSPTWSKDGDTILFTSKVFPEFGADDEKNALTLEAIKKTPFKAHAADNLLFRHWASWANGRRTHVLAFHLKSKTLKDLTPGDYDSPVFNMGGASYDLSPDGEELCVASNREPLDARAWTTNADIFLISKDGKSTVNITKDNLAFDGHPLYSPDGRFIAFVRQARPGFESDRYRIAVYDRTKREIKILTEGFDEQIHDFSWMSDSRRIVFQASSNGRFPLFSLDTQSGAIERISTIPSSREFSVSSDGKILFSDSSIDDPFELYLDSRAGDKPRRITSINRKLVEDYDIRPPEEMWFDGPNGKKIHTFIVKPHGFQEGKKYPLILNVHGGPQYQWSDSFRGDWQVYPASGFIVAFPNPHGSLGYGSKFWEAISKDWGGKVFEDILAVTDQLADLPYVDEDRMGAMGWSYGGYMMNWLMGQTDRFKAMASMMGVYDIRSFYGATEELWFPEWDVGETPWENPEGYSKWNPADHADKFKTPTLVITGERDYRIPYTQSIQLFTALRRRDVPARLIVLPNDGHWPSYVGSMPIYYAAHLDWFTRYLQGKEGLIDTNDLIRGTIF